MLERSKEMGRRIEVFERKIEEYYLSCMPAIEQMEDKVSFLPQWPLYRFSITRLHHALTHYVPESMVSPVAEKLIDIKLHYAYLLTVPEHFLKGATLIVGNNELEKLNPRTISALRGIHYRVFLLSALFEQTLDLLHLVLKGQASNFKKGKWGKIVALTREATGEAIISEADAALIDSFKGEARTAEMHKYSMVRALIGKNQWTHLQEEEQAAARLLVKVYEYFAT